jgi:5,10-methylenetetrahydrofolate reductase
MSNSSSSSEPNPKIIDLIAKKEAGSKPFVSIEFFPPRTDAGVKVRRQRPKEAKQRTNDSEVAGKFGARE